MQSHHIMYYALLQHINKMIELSKGSILHNPNMHQ